MQSTYMYGKWDSVPHDFDEVADAIEREAMGEITHPHQASAAKQSKADSFMESVCNIAVGFVISWMVWIWIVAPIMGYDTHAGEGFWITCIFTVTSLIRQYVLRRIFNGRTIWESIRAKVT